MADKLLLPNRPIALVGLMGAGKSTIGRRLAKRLGLDFIDSDEEIELAAHHKIAEIFERFGEAGFRDGERRVIARLIEGPPKVIATGGGAFMNDETRALILKRCISIWLDADVEILAERVARSDHRPLVKDKDPLPILRELATVRNPVYALADVHIKIKSLPQERTVDHIVRALAEWGQRA